MSTTTPNLGLSQPQMTDQVNQTIPQLANDLSIIDTSVGNLSNLATTNKTSLVAAINENASLIGTENTSIGTLSNLQTTDKSNLVNAINEVNSDLDTETSRRKDLGTNVKDYNASGSTNTYTGTIASGSQTLTLTTSTHDFVVGQGIAIPSAGAAGAKLVTTVSGVNGSTITVSNAANATATSVTVSHDDTVALQAAFNVGGDVRVPAGDYSISSSITITNTVNIYGAIGKTIIDNAGTGAAFIIALGSGCTIDGLTIRGTSISGSGILLNTSCKLSNLVITGNGRYGIEFSDTANVISQHTNKCTISYNILGGVYSKSTAAYQKNAVTFLQCYVVANGDQTQTGATSSTGHGYFVQGGIDWTIIGGVSETNIGAGIFIQSTSSYSVYGFNVQGEHLESNRYANILVDVTNGTMTDVHIEGNYYFNATNYSGSLITTTSCRTIVLNYASMTYSNIDLTYGNNTIKTLFMQQKQSLKLGGEIESISPYLPYTKHAVSGDPLASSYNILRLDSTLGPGYTESTDLSTFVDPRDSYRIIFEYRYNKSSSTSATLSFLQLDGTKSNIGSPISTGLASGDTWFTQELLVNSQFLTLTRYLQISATINGTVGASDYLLIRKIMIYRLNGAVAPSGPTTSRPTFVVVGYMYFDTTLNKPIWCKVNGSPGTWVDATGTTV